MLKKLFKKGQTAAEAVWSSKYYLAFLLLTEFVAVFCDAALECMYFYVFLCVLFMIFSDDLLSIIPTVMFTLLTSVSYYKDFSVLTQYMWYAIVPFALALTLFITAEKSFSASSHIPILPFRRRLSSEVSE